jgi:hypothetical protein
MKRLSLLLPLALLASCITHAQKIQCDFTKGISQYCTLGPIGTPQDTLFASDGKGGYETFSGVPGSGTVTSFAAPSASWPAWLVPTVATATSTPSLTVAFSAGSFPTLNQSTTGNAATATALAATPTLCSTGNAPTGILANGNATGCAAISGGGGGATYTPGATGTIAIDSVAHTIDTTASVARTDSSSTFTSLPTFNVGVAFDETNAGTSNCATSSVHDCIFYDATLHAPKYTDNAGVAHAFGSGGSGTALVDTNGVNTIASGPATTSAVNYLLATNEPTGGKPWLTPDGSDTNLGLNIGYKGVGNVYIGGNSSGATNGDSSITVYDHATTPDVSSFPGIVLNMPSITGNEKVAIQTNGTNAWIFDVDGGSGARQFRSSFGGFYVDATGVLRSKDITLSGGSEPGCASGNRGQFWYVPGAAGVADKVEVCAKDAADAYAWHLLY